MTHFCSACGRQLLPTEIHQVVCSRCEHRMRGWLRELPHQYTLLVASLHRERQGPATTVRSSGRAHAPAPAREDVLNLLGAGAPGTVRDTQDDQTGPAPMHEVLHAWADQLADNRDEALLPARPGKLHTGYLTAHLPYAMRQPWYPFMHAEIGILIQQVRDITRTRPRRYALPAPCPRPDCVAFQLVREDWQLHIHCEACGLQLTEEDYTAHESAVMPPLYRTAVLLVARAVRAGEDGPPLTAAS